MNTSCDVLDARCYTKGSAFYVWYDWRHGCIKNDRLDIVMMESVCNNVLVTQVDEPFINEPMTRSHSFVRVPNY